MCVRIPHIIILIPHRTWDIYAAQNPSRRAYVQRWHHQSSNTYLLYSATPDTTQHHLSNFANSLPLSSLPSSHLPPNLHRVINPYHTSISPFHHRPVICFKQVITARNTQNPSFPYSQFKFIGKQHILTSTSAMHDTSAFSPKIISGSGSSDAKTYLTRLAPSQNSGVSHFAHLVIREGNYHLPGSDFGVDFFDFEVGLCFL